ncbi:hypothetical protein FBUS_01845 [Fasciolopsis buskii]|uniref:Uncharacterized protein n=1 Tax=Fasciolopsis buskii TaxID=27845 RepID=A0A8E0S9X8_9TREM|nr:hypothetical protein FBUS_01845 [Fasciolopsis buski]
MQTWRSGWPVKPMFSVTCPCYSNSVFSRRHNPTIRNFWQEVCSQIPEAKDDNPERGRALSAASAGPALRLGSYQPRNSGMLLVRGSLVPGVDAGLAIFCPGALDTLASELRVLSKWIEEKLVHENMNSRFHIKISEFSCKI